MEYFIFNGINSNDMNIIVKKLPSIVRANQRINTISLEGRSGTLHEIEDKFDSYNNEIECVVMPGANINNIKSWLMGQAKLILSSNPNVEYTVTVVNKVDFSKYLSFLREFPIELEFQPIAYSIEEKSVEVDADEELECAVGGNYKTYPIIKVTGNGSITCNGNTFIITNNANEIFIDCELMNAYFNDINKNGCVNGLENPIYLKPGNNIITTIGVSAVLSYREAWL